ncbi:hypothetical protein AVL62_02465 [Serinicoccus chungangensis]|uniref:Uncharacterized protein n=1 Tax=Serinicoccus chungangensis TaxID=767452 RepID=A0A0W8I633_9MICO|nr:hypothetical protein [Serinicoccus chungangensis]KUG53660.1 hypothetical protein AVL62_02465 [Serinicoccus chungangensis]
MTGIDRPPGPTAARPPSGAVSRPAALLRAAEEVSLLAPDLGWSEASGLVEALLDGVAHVLADAATGLDRPRPQPLVVGAIGGADRVPDHAGCRAAAGRLRALAGEVLPHPAPWVTEAAGVMTELGDLLDRVADRTRSGTLTRADKGVVLRRLHGLHRRWRAVLPGPGGQDVR